MDLDSKKIAGWIDERVREAVKEVFEQIMEAEADELICAKPHERTDERQDYRNGKRKRKLQTRVGEIELEIPRLRVLNFQTEVIERYRRMEISLEEAMIEMYLSGVSTRKISDITEALCDTTVSPQKQSRLNKKVYEKLDKFINRPLDTYYPYLYLDGMVIKNRLAGRYENISILIAVGVNAGGYREVLGVVEGGKEDAASWKSFLKHLKTRGLKRTDLIISDAHLGLRSAAEDVFPKAGFQRCIVHFYRNVLTKVPRRMMTEVSDGLKAIHAQEDEDEARVKAQRFINKHKKGLPGAMAILEAGLEDTLTYYRFPQKHRKRIRTNNPMERHIKEARRRTKAVGSFPDSRSAVMLVTARFRWHQEKRWEKKRYLDIELLSEMEDEKPQKEKKKQLKGELVSIGGK
ncbi:MAG: IS256 family transposase [Kosmotogaceae bacterium]|nr:IS256 family transposase [Kosmotogaceae bacterium]